MSIGFDACGLVAIDLIWVEFQLVSNAFGLERVGSDWSEAAWDGSPRADLGGVQWFALIWVSSVAPGLVFRPASV